MYIAQSVGDDADLLREVESLLPHYVNLAGFEPSLPMPLKSRPPSGEFRPRGAAGDLEEDEWKPPFAIAPYRIEEILGRGGMGVVYRGIHSTRPLSVAIKVLRRRLVDRGFIRFKQEEELLRRLQHPGIVRFLYGGEVVMRCAPGRCMEDRRPYIVMEYIKGQPLVKYADFHGLDVLRRLDLLNHICDALEYAHYRGVVHCDLKPDNILVDATGQPRILDFGIARFQNFSVRPNSESKHFAGTLAYASPEQRLPQKLGLSPQSDVYSLGLIMHELLTGRLPKRSGGRIVLDLSGVNVEIDTAHPANDELRHVLRVIIATALRGTRGRRYTSAGELGADLAEVRRAFTPQSGSRLAAWLSTLRREPASSSTAHSRLLCTILRTRIGMGIDM